MTALSRIDEANVYTKSSNSDGRKLMLQKPKMKNSAILKIYNSILREGPDLQEPVLLLDHISSSVEQKCRESEDLHDIFLQIHG